MAKSKEFEEYLAAARYFVNLENSTPEEDERLKTAGRELAKKLTPEELNEAGMILMTEFGILSTQDPVN